MYCISSMPTPLVRRSQIGFGVIEASEPVYRLGQAAAPGEADLDLTFTHISVVVTLPKRLRVLFLPHCAAQYPNKRDHLNPDWATIRLRISHRLHTGS
jgi:hypothetical protein